MRSFKIGNVLIPGNLILGPMAGVTDLPFRLLCKEQGADLVYTEMISAKGIYYNNKNTEKLWEIADEEHPAALQLFGSDPDLMAEMARKIDHRNFDILDINMGCPVPKVVNNGEGSALMKTPELAAKIIRKVSQARPLNFAKALPRIPSMQSNLPRWQNRMVQQPLRYMDAPENSIIVEKQIGISLRRSKKQ